MPSQSEIPLHTLSDDMHSSFAHKNACEGQLVSGNSMNKNILFHETHESISIHIFNDMQFMNSVPTIASFIFVTIIQTIIFSIANFGALNASFVIASKVVEGTCA